MGEFSLYFEVGPTETKMYEGTCQGSRVACQNQFLFTFSTISASGQFLKILLSQLIT